MDYGWGEVFAGGGVALVVGVGFGVFRSLAQDLLHQHHGAGRAARELPRVVGSVIAATLPMAIGARNALAEQGRELPLILCEDTPLAAHVRPSFTTVAIAPETLGTEMVRLVSRHARAEPAPELHPELVRRETF